MTLIALAVVVLLAICLDVGGELVFRNAPGDPLERADAVLVLGGEHDGREEYGLALARAGWAPTVVISDAYPADDPVLARICRPTPRIEVLCPRAALLTTRGEAEMVAKLATARGWHRIIVVSWRFHLPRARLVFRQCFSRDGRSVVMQAVPRGYHYSLGEWQWVYAYQFAGLLKALALGSCGGGVQASAGPVR